MSDKMPRKDVAYSGMICSIKERIAELADMIREKLRSVNGVTGDASGNVTITGDGPIIVESDQGQHGIVVSLDESMLPSGAVTSVNGRTGDVTLYAGNVPSETGNVQNDLTNIRLSLGDVALDLADEAAARHDADSVLQTNINNVISMIPQALTFDSVPTDGSVNPVTSNGIYDALQEKQNVLTAGDGIAIDGGVIEATADVAWVKRGVTTYDEVRQKLSEGKFVLTKDSYNIIYFCNTSFVDNYDPGIITFGRLFGGRLSNGFLDYQHIDLYKTNNRWTGPYYNNARPAFLTQSNEFSATYSQTFNGRVYLKNTTQLTGLLLISNGGSISLNTDSLIYPVTLSGGAASNLGISITPTLTAGDLESIGRINLNQIHVMGSHKADGSQSSFEIISNNFTFKIIENPNTHNVNLVISACSSDGRTWVDKTLASFDGTAWQ